MPPSDAWFGKFLFVIQILGLVAFSLSGVIEAKRKQMDVVGAMAVAFVTSFGGGTLRDVLLGRFPVFWIRDDSYAIATLVIALVGFYATRTTRYAANAMLIPDAFGLGLFSVLGTIYALESGASPFIAILLGVVTAIVGGVLRDVICNEVPIVFRRSPLYATCAALGATMFWALQAAGAAQWTAMLTGIIVATVLRLLAVRFDLSLPEPRAKPSA